MDLVSLDQGVEFFSLGCALMYFCSWDLLFSGAKSRFRILLADICSLALVLLWDGVGCLSKTAGDAGCGAKPGSRRDVLCSSMG